jgi:hypothetical protein
MYTSDSHDQDEAQTILAALREIQDNPELQPKGKRDQESILNRLGLSGTARHSVAAGLAVMFMVAAPATTQGWWQ